MAQLGAWWIALAVPLVLGCVSSTARTVGSGAMLVGGASAVVGAGEVTGVRLCTDERETQDALCASEEPNPEVGAPMVVAGLGMLVAGGVVYGLAKELPPRRQRHPPTRNRQRVPDRDRPRPLF